MLTERNIIYFEPFFFKNGNKSKNKYFVVLKNDQRDTVLASLPTSKDFIPNQFLIKDGCIEEPLININCYCFSDKTIITECGKNFERPTFIYGYQIDIYSEKILLDLYRIDGTDYTVWGKMKEEVFDKLKSCLKNSKSVKRKYKKLL